MYPLKDEELLIKDLCARVPYHTIVSVAKGEHVYTEYKITWDKEELTLSLLHQIGENGAWEYIKPYLLPLSNMTEEEKKEYQELEKQCESLPTFAYISVSKCILFDWLDAHHFDYRGLIKRGLAIEAPKGFYN